MLLSLIGCTETRAPGSDPDRGSLGTLPVPSGHVDSGTDDSGSGSGSGDDSGADDSGPIDTGPKPWLVPDFALVDLNTSSPTHGHTISPRDYKKRISGWYFIHAD
jgi:hypothetical protein